MPAREAALRRAIALLPGEVTPLEAASSAVLEGRVVSNEDGHAIGGAALVFEGPGGAHTTRSADDGQFRFVSETEGAFELVLVEAPGFVTAVNVLSVGAHRGTVVRGVVVELTPDRADAGGGAPASPGRVQNTDGAILTGRVRREGSREPVTVFSVILSRRLGAMQSETVLGRAFADASGEFALRDLAPGDYDVRVGAAGYVVSAPRPVSLAASRPTDVEIGLAPSCVVTGSVVSDRGGAALAGARVGLETGVSGPGLTSAALADARGRFSVATLEAGPTSLNVSAPGHHTRVVAAGCAAGESARALGEVRLTALEPGEAPRIELTGIGAVLTGRGDALVVGEVLAGGGAAAAGLAPGDRVEAVDERPVDELGFRGAIEAIRGPEGSTVRLLVSRGDGPARVLVAERRRVRR